MRVWLKDARVAAKMTLKELSNATGVSFQALAYYEAGLRTPKPQTASTIERWINDDTEGSEKRRIFHSQAGRISEGEPGLDPG